MIYKVLPPLSIVPGGPPLPQSQTSTSFTAAKVAEQLYHVPVRQIAGDYIKPLQAIVSATRLDSRLRREFFVQKRDDKIARYSLSCISPTIERQAHPYVIRAALIPNQPLLSAYMFTVDAMHGLCDVAYVRDGVGLAPLPPEHAQFAAILTEQDSPYWMLLHSLERYGTVRGITYDYDVDMGSVLPRYHDTRTIYIKADSIPALQEFLETVQDDPWQPFYDLDQKSLLQALHDGQRIDGDAGPLFDFFQEAFTMKKDVEKIRKIEQRAGLGIGINPTGRNIDVGVTTFVKAF